VTVMYAAYGEADTSGSDTKAVWGATLASANAVASEVDYLCNRETYVSTPETDPCGKLREMVWVSAGAPGVSSFYVVGGADDESRCESANWSGWYDGTNSCGADESRNLSPTLCELSYEMPAVTSTTFTVRRCVYTDGAYVADEDSEAKCTMPPEPDFCTDSKKSGCGRTCARADLVSRTGRIATPSPAAALAAGRGGRATSGPTEATAARCPLWAGSGAAAPPIATKPT